MPTTVCCVTSCLSKNITMFHFPRNKNMQSQWLMYVAPHSPELLQLTSEQLIKKKICIRHFENQYLDGCKRKYHGFPTLLTKEEMDSGTPNRPSISVNYSDHTYCKRGNDVEESVPEIVQKPMSSEESMPSDNYKCTDTKLERPLLVTNINTLTPKCRKLYFKCKDVIKKRRLYMSSKDIGGHITL